MSTLGYSARVGLVVVIAAIIGIWGFLFFQNHLSEHETYPLTVTFADATGLIKDTPVTLAGVQIGKVADVILLPATQQAAAKLKIDKKWSIPTGSTFVIVTPVLGTTGTLSVVPPPDVAQNPKPALAPGAIVAGQRPADLQASLESADKLLSQLQTTMGKVNTLLDRTTTVVGGPQVQRTLSNVQASSDNIRILTGQLGTLMERDNAQLTLLLAQMQSGAKSTIGNLTAATADVKGITSENREAITEIVGNMRDTTAALEGITSQANSLLGPQGGVSKNVSATMANVNAMTANLSATTAKLNDIAGNVQKMTGDTQVQSDLRSTVHNIKETTDQTTVLVARLNKILGVKPKPAAVVVAPGGTAAVVVAPGAAATVPQVDVPQTAGPEYLPRVDLLQNTRDSHFRMDLDVLLPYGFTPEGFVRTGVNSVADNDRFTLQYGSVLDRKQGIASRFGLYKSKLGVGADYGLGKNFSINGDLYDPNHARADIKGVYMFDHNMGLVIGGDDIWRHTGTVVGLEYRR